MIIYKITNDINDRVYIGQTTSSSLKARIKQYKNEVEYREKYIRPIIAAMRKYGMEHFKFEIIEDNISSKEELDQKEIMYIQQFNSLCSQNGYNLEHGGNSAGKHDESVKKKIGDAQRGSLNHMFGCCGNKNGRSRAVIELTTGEIFESANLAASYYHINFSHVCACARGTRGSTAGKVFRYLDENQQPIKNENQAVIKNLKVRNSVLKQYQYLI